MGRVTDGQVKEIIETNLDDISLFMETAEMIVDEQLMSKGFSENRLSKIELYLSAHFVALRERQLLSERFGDSEEKYQGKTGMNLQASLYGQTAMLLDTSGSLANLGKSVAEIYLI